MALGHDVLGPKAAYGWINLRIAAALASLGVPSEIAQPSVRSARPDSGACFQSAASGEVMAEGNDGQQETARNLLNQLN